MGSAVTVDAVGLALLSQVEGPSISNALMTALQSVFRHQLVHALDLVDRKSVTRFHCPAGRRTAFQACCLLLLPARAAWEPGWRCCQDRPQTNPGLAIVRGNRP